MELNENILESCKAIVKSIVEEANNKTRALKYFDFIDKFNIATAVKKTEILPRKKFDVIIFTIVPVEFDTLNKILNVSTDLNDEDYDLNGIWYYEFEIPRSYQRRSLKALVTLVGIAGDVNCSLACVNAFQKFSCDLSILCGIAAGVESQIKKYSTVVSQSIINYEFQRIEKDRITYRPIPYSIDRYNENITAKFVLHADKWRNEFFEAYDLLIKDENKALGKTNELNNDNVSYVTKESLKEVELKTGIIASGAKLLADGETIQDLRDNIPIQKGIIAVEMEGSGFSPACIEFKRNWLVFRGISDYGEADKNDLNNKKNQKIAAASAITAMIYYLKNLYRAEDERDDLKF